MCTPVSYTHLNNFNVKFNEIKNEIQRRNCNIDKVDKLNENKDKVSSGENYDNRITNMVLENNCVSIESGDKGIMLSLIHI